MASMHTSADSTAPAAARRGVLALWGFVGAIAALATVGAVLAVLLLTGGSSDHGARALPTGPFGVGDDIPTSFGAVSVGHAEKINGLANKDLAGAAHGIAGKVEPNQVGVQAQISITNLLDRPLAYTPTQFSLISRKGGKSVRAGEVRASIRPGRLQPDASIDARLSFVAPRNGSDLWIQFDDPGRDKPVLIDLGRTGTTPKDAFAGPGHGKDH